jgi:hypothetical protein
LGSFPFTYLGLPISDRGLSAGDWQPLTAKVEKRAEPWMGKFMSFAARLTLINACLSSLPMHAMGVCLLGKGIHKQFDKHRSRFYWNANGRRNKYHWVRWSAMCKPKTLGGLGIIDTNLMNTCLMARWVWRLYRGETGLWADILRGKYLQDRDVWVASSGPGSQFWKALQKIKLVLRLGAKHHVGNGASTHFWLDWWVGAGKLQDRFPNLFAIAEMPEASVASLWSDTGWAIPFRRELGLPERVEWVNLMRDIEALRPTDTLT